MTNAELQAAYRLIPASRLLGAFLLLFGVLSALVIVFISYGVFLTIRTTDLYFPSWPFLNMMMGLSFLCTLCGAGLFGIGQLLAQKAKFESYVSWVNSLPTHGNDPIKPFLKKALFHNNPNPNVDLSDDESMRVDNALRHDVDKETRNLIYWTMSSDDTISRGDMDAILKALPFVSEFFLRSLKQKKLRPLANLGIFIGHPARYESLMDLDAEWIHVDSSEMHIVVDIIRLKIDIDEIIDAIIYGRMSFEQAEEKLKEIGRQATAQMARMKKSIFRYRRPLNFHERGLSFPP